VIRNDEKELRKPDISSKVKYPSVIFFMLKQQSDKALEKAIQAQQAGQFEDAFKSLKLAIRYVRLPV
jgi:hypothetical protein